MVGARRLACTPPATPPRGALGQGGDVMLGARRLARMPPILPPRQSGSLFYVLGISSPGGLHPFVDYEQAIGFAGLWDHGMGG